MTNLLRLEERLESHKCAALIKFIANAEEKDFPKSKLIHYLVVKSDMPGSGVAVALSCDLSGFPWKSLLKKRTLNLEMMQALVVSLKGTITTQDVDDIIHYYSDKNVALLNFALCNSTHKFDSSVLIKLCEQAMKLKKLSFANTVINYSLSVEDSSKLIQQALKAKNFDFIEVIISQGANVDPVKLLNKMSKSDILAKSSLISFILSTPEGREQLCLKAVKYSEFKLAEDCLVNAEGETTSRDINLSSVLEHLNLGINSEERQQLVLFVKNLLELGLNPNGQDGEACPLDVALMLSNEYQSEKRELLLLLLQYGATIECCTYPRGKGTTLIHEVTKFAIDSGKNQTLWTSGLLNWTPGLQF